MKHFDVILTCNYSPWSSYTGGGQKSTHALASALSALGLQVCVVYSRVSWEKIEVPPLPYTVKWAFFFALKPGISSFFRFLNGISFYFKVRKFSTNQTVIHSNGDEGSLLGFLKNKKRFIYTNRYPKFSPFLNHTNWKNVSSWIKVFFLEPRFVAIALAMKGADEITATSQYSVEELALNFSFTKSRIHCVHNGIDPDFIKTNPISLPSGILYFGRITHAKGVDILIQAYASLPKEIQKLHPLTIVGQGPFLKNIILDVEQYHLQRNIKFHSWKKASELAQLIACSKVIALPSREESFGNTMLETLAVGGTLITTNAGSLPEIIGKHGIQIPSDDKLALVSALKIELHRDVTKIEIENRKNYVHSNFSWESTARKFLELYEYKTK